MKIDFSDYDSFTDKDIINVNKEGLTYSRGMIHFEECLANFCAHYNTSENCIGEYDTTGSYPSLCFYTAPTTTHFFFIEDLKKFDEVRDHIKGFGYTFMNIENVI